MPPLSSRYRQRLLAYGYLTPFAALAIYGLLGWSAWRTGNLGLVQPRIYDAALPANACACFVLLGLTPIAIGLNWRRLGLGLASVATLVAWATLIQSPLNVDFHLDDLLVNHAAVVAGPDIS